jgi:hypothetical protein
MSRPLLRLDLLGDLLDSLNVLLDILLQILSDDGSTALLGGFVHGDTGELCDTDEGEEEVDGGQEHVLGLDDEAPAGPDDTRAGEGEVLGEGELLGGTGEVGDTGEDKTPLLFCCFGIALVQFFSYNRQDQT